MKGDAGIKPLFLLLLFAAALPGICLPSWAGDRAVISGDILITVRDTAVVKGETILLGEIAAIHAPLFLKDGLADLELGRSPKPGKMSQIKGSRIHKLILNHDLVDPGMRIEVPARVFVKRGSQEIGDEILRKKADQYLAETLGTESYVIKMFQVRGMGVYPQGGLSLVMARKGAMDKKGRFSFQLDVMVDEIKRGRLDIKGRVALYRRVAVAARDLKRGSALSDADVKFQDTDVFQLNGDPLASVADVRQMVLNVNIKMGDALEKGDFRPAPVVKRGEVIKLVARKETLSIVTLGVCREDGYANEPVRVENLQSGKVVRGLVAPDATVVVIF